MSTRYQGQIDATYYFVAENVSTGARMTTLTYTDFTVQYIRADASGTYPSAVTAITEATQTVTGAHSDWGIVHIFNGLYRLDAADAVQASGVVRAFLDISATNMRSVTIEVDLPASDPFAAGYTLQQISDAVLTLSDIDGETLQAVMRGVSAVLLGTNDATGTQALPKFLALDGSKVRATAATTQDRKAANWTIDLT